MKQESVFLMVSLIILVVGSSTALGVPRVEASGTIYLRADGSIDPPDAPISTFDNVTYTLTGNVTSDADGIVVLRDNIVVNGAGFTVEGTGAEYYSGIYFSEIGNVTIQNTNIENFHYGIQSNSSSNNSISGNNIINNSVFGILLISSSSNNTISGNNITNNSNNGIDLDSSSNNSISGNNITSSGIGIELHGSSDYNGINGNNIANNGYYGIRLDYSSNYNNINGNNITNNFAGILLRSSSNNSVGENTITDNREGIYLESSSNNRIEENNITDNPGVAIEFREFSNNNSISGNNITNSVVFLESSSSNVSGNTFTDAGVELWGSYANSVENNTVNGRPLIYLEGMAGFNIVDAGQVVLVRCTGIRVENLDLSRTTVGVELWETNNSIVSGNNITSTGVYPIMLGYSSNNSISGNTIANSSAVGIPLWGSSNNSISGNMVIANEDKGIELCESSNYNSVRGNNITDSGIGIWLYGSSNNSIDGNTIANSHWGISFRFTSGNTVCHNNFINNTVQVNDYLEPEQANFWDDGCEGNYWSNYSGTDRDPDGIGDTPVIIDANNVDNYPLMGTFQSYNVTSAGLSPLLYAEVDIICNATIGRVYLSYCDDVHSPTGMDLILQLDEISGQNGTNSFCRVTFPNAWLNSSNYPVYTGFEENQPSSKIISTNSTHTTIYFIFTQPVTRIDIIPEFSFLSIPLFMIATLLAIITYRRKHR